jgi:hypothetical protein
MKMGAERVAFTPQLVSLKKWSGDWTEHRVATIQIHESGALILEEIDESNSPIETLILPPGQWFGAKVVPVA